MFGFGKKKPAPSLCPGNPGIGSEAKVAFSNGDQSWTEKHSWTEKIDLVRLAAPVFKRHGHSVANEGTWLHHRESGLMILPQLVAIEPLDDGGARTVTTIQVNHPTMIPTGVFEYQHAAGDSVAESITQGIDQWVQTDFVALLQAARNERGPCMTLEMEFPADSGKPPRVRRAILGPVAHFMQEPPEQAEACSADEHPFCPCCLLTRSFEAFKELLERDDFYGLRLFAAREPDGTPGADCRINGEDWAPGAEALRAYASSWSPAGYEFRKQYVVLQSVDKRD